MPTYQYACTQCDERLEAVQSFTDPALTDCPVCVGRLRKVFSAVGVVFKGSGFYKNDSRGPSGNGDAAGEKKGDKAGDGSSTEGGNNNNNKDGGGTKDGGNKDKGTSKDGGTKQAAPAMSASSGASGSTPAAKSA